MDWNFELNGLMEHEWNVMELELNLAFGFGLNNMLGFVIAYYNLKTMVECKNRIEDWIRLRFNVEVLWKYDLVGNGNM